MKLEHALAKRPVKQDSKLDRRRSTNGGILSKKKAPTTFLAVGLGLMGHSLKFIANECGLSEGTVHYRLKMFGVTVKDYRSGDSDFSWELRKLAKPLLTKAVAKMAEKL